MAFDGYTSLSFERPRPGVLLVLLDRPAQLNATDATLHTELARVWRDIEADDDSRAGSIPGRGDSFCAGGDLDLIEEQIGNFDVLVRTMDDGHPIVGGVLETSK